MGAGPQPRKSHKIGVVTGLASEAALARALSGDAESVMIVCAGASAERAGHLARRLVDEGATALLSFGIAGALDPAFSCGDLIVPDEVLLDEVGDPDLFRCDSAWSEALHAALAEVALTCRRGLLIGSHRLCRDAKDKQARYEITGAVAVDMESGAVARAAAQATLPFLAVRAVADTAQDSLPTLAETAVKPDGTPAVGRVLAGLLRRPGELPALLSLGRRSEAALARLRKLEAVKDDLFRGCG